MIKCKSKNGFDVWVSSTYDCKPNLGGYFCQVYIDSECNKEVDDFVVPALIVNAHNDRRFIIEHMRNTDVDAIAEWCPHCCDEVTLLKEFKVQKCPSCGNEILPCSMCDECTDKCPLAKDYNKKQHASIGRKKLSSSTLNYGFAATQDYTINALNFNADQFADKVQLVLGDDYEIVVEDGKIYACKKMVKYFEDFESCCKYLNVINSGMPCVMAHHLGHPMEAFARLLICRDAYWKIAGEQMGLDTPWEPNDDAAIYNISRTKNIIRLGGACWGGNCNILEFPTEEMRDAFYDNFKTLIESCKDLL